MNPREKFFSFEEYEKWWHEQVQENCKDKSSNFYKQYVNGKFSNLPRIYWEDCGEDKFFKFLNNEERG